MQTLELNPPPTIPTTIPTTSWRSRAITPAPAQTQAPPPAAPPAPRHKSKFNLTGLAPKETAKTTTAYPTVPDPTGVILELATRIKRDSAKLESLEGAIETAKAQLRNLVEPSYFNLHSGKKDVPSSIAVNTPEGDLLVTFSSRYKKIESPDPILQTFGEEFFAANFTESFSITIDGSQLPTVDPANPDRNPAQEFIDDLVAMIQHHHAADAVKQETKITPTKQFHDTRHALLAPDQNLKLQSLCPMVVMIKTKGRDSK
jgi:hypothetical protein